MNAKELKQHAVEFGADLIGVAPVGRFKDVPKEKHPLSIYPDCKSVVVIGRRILRGALRGVEEGTNFGSTYQLFGLSWLDDNFISKTTYDLTCLLEEHGFEAVPLFGYDASSNMAYGVPVAPDKPAPNVIIDVNFAAWQAGLGVRGKGGFFLTPQFGPRQRFASILTDLELDPDPVLNLDFCENCTDCIDACPLNALGAASRDDAICASCHNGAFSPKGRGGERDRVAASCGRACVLSLETRGLLNNKFNHPFRKRLPWRLDAFRRVI